MTFTVPHRTTVAAAPDRVDASWEYDHQARLIRALVPSGALHMSVSIHVCSTERPRLNAAPIRRWNAETWIVLPVRYVGPNLVPTRTALDEILTVGDALELRQSPESTNALLEQL